MEVCIESGLSCVVSSTIDLPKGKTWDDVDLWYVKWDSLFVKFKNDSDYTQIELNSDTTDSIDWKWPSITTIYPVYNDHIDYDTELAQA